MLCCQAISLTENRSSNWCDKQPDSTPKNNHRTIHPAIPQSGNPGNRLKGHKKTSAEGARGTKKGKKKGKKGLF